jgi:PAS domain S-box-containing protein
MKPWLEKLLRGPVSKKILLLVLVSFLAPFGIIINNGVERQKSALNKAKAEALYLVEEEADVQRAAASATRQMLVSLSVMHDSLRRDPKTCGEALSRLIEQSPDYSNILILDADGRVISSALAPGSQSRSADGAHGHGPGGHGGAETGWVPAYYADIASTTEFTVSGKIICPVTGQPALAFASPLMGEGGRGGMAVAVVRTSGLSRITHKSSLPTVASLEVADPSGRLLYSAYAQGVGERGAARMDPRAMAMLAGEEERGVALVMDAGGPGSVLAFQKLRLHPGEAPYLYVAAAMPASEVLRRANAVLWRDMALALAAAVIALFTALAAGRFFITRRMDRIIAAAGQMGSGRLNARTGVDYSDGEVGRLAQAFDSMADVLSADIKSREKTERELASSREFLDKIINTIGDPIFVKDEAHRLILVNDAECALTGRPRQEVIGRDDHAFFPKEQVDYFWERDNLVLETGEEDVSEELITDAGGKLRVIVTKKTRYIDPDGKRFVVGVIRDVTEAKMAGNELIKRTQELDERVRMLDCLHGVSHLGQMRAITQDNLFARAALLVAGSLTYPGARARISYDSHEYRTPDYTPPAASIRADILVRGEAKGFVEAGYAKEMPARDHGPFSKEERKILKVVAGQLGRIAERIMAEAELRNSEERFRRIVETANEGIAVLDANQRITYVNEVMAGMLGYEPQELAGKSLESYAHEPNSALARHAAARDGKGERLFLRKDGGLLCVIASVTPITDSGGHFVGSFGMYADITERKRTEEKLQELNLRLEQLVRERTEDLYRKSEDLQNKAAELETANAELARTARKLDIARRKAVDATKAKSIFLANMSHEVRTPINAILGLSDLALRRGADGQSQTYLEKILKSSRELLALVNDILDFSKLEAGKATVESIDFNLPRMVEDAAGVFRHQAEAKGLSLAVAIDDDVPRFVRSDPAKVRAILNNLLSNALKFTTQGGVTVGLRFSRRVVTFEVADTGIGIPGDKRFLIFDSFRQGDESIGRKFGGTGLGLSICRRLAELMGGAITAAKRPGGGSVFIVKLPLPVGKENEDQPAERAERLKAAQAMPPMRVLLAEDHEMGRELMTSFLGGLGHHVSCAEDGSKALELLRNEDFDLVLMDGRMPVMDGLQTAKAIRAGACGPQKASIPIVALTAQAMEGDRRMFFAAGMDDYVTKPVDLDEVLLVMAKYSSGNRKDAPPGPGADEGGTQGGASEPRASRRAHGSEAPGADAPGETLPLVDRAPALARLKGIEALLAAMESTFLSTTPEDLDGLRRAAKAGDAGDARLYAHRMKGNAAAVGAVRLSEAAREAEMAAAGGAVPGEEALARLDGLFELTRQAMAGRK